MTCSVLRKFGPGSPEVRSCGSRPPARATQRHIPARNPSSRPYSRVKVHHPTRRPAHSESSGLPPLVSPRHRLISSPSQSPSGPPHAHRITSSQLCFIPIARGSTRVFPKVFAREMFPRRRKWAAPPGKSTPDPRHPRTPRPLSPRHPFGTSPERPRPTPLVMKPPFVIPLLILLHSTTGRHHYIHSVATRAPDISPPMPPRPLTHALNPKRPTPAKHRTCASRLHLHSLHLFVTTSQLTHNLTRTRT